MVNCLVGADFALWMVLGVLVLLKVGGFRAEGGSLARRLTYAIDR